MNSGEKEKNIELMLGRLSLADLVVLQTTANEMIEPLTSVIQSEPTDDQLAQIERLQRLRELAARERVSRVADLLNLVE